MAFVAITLHALHSNKTPMISQHSHHTLQKALVFAQFVFQSANVQLLFTQHWSFVSSVLTPKEGTVWFAPIAGVGSVISTLAAAHVSTVVDAIGLTYCLGLAAILIACSSWFADRAYRIAAKVSTMTCMIVPDMIIRYGISRVLCAFISVFVGNPSNRDMFLLEWI